MPDIDPTALHSADPPQSLNPSTLTLSKPKDAAANAAAAQKAAKAEKDKGQQRIDIEPIYAQLKANIGEKWAEYKETIGLFVIGQLNQSELCLRIDHLVCYTPETEHLHNCFVAALFANCHRDPPEPGVAPWVAANDKPATGLGGSATGKGGDKIEEKLKREVKLLPGRDRRRLKEIGEREPYDPNAGYPVTQANDYRIARSIRLPDSVPTSAGGLSKTNLDLEIRKRYTHSTLSHETLEFPDANSIQHRLQSICYEEGLPNGAMEQCSELVATATETYIKDVVSSVLSITRSNNLQNNHHTKSKSHSDSAVGGRAINLGDMRFALEINSCNIGYMPDIMAEVRGSWREGILEGWDEYDQELDLDPAASSVLYNSGANKHSVPSTSDALPPKANGVLTNGNMTASGTQDQSPAKQRADPTDDMPVRAKRKRDLANGEMEHFRGMVETATDGWAGSSTDDRDVLFGLLDKCLSVG